MGHLFAALGHAANDVTPYLAKLNAAAHALDPSRPTVACSDQDGNINFITRPDRLAAGRRLAQRYDGTT